MKRKLTTERIEQFLQALRDNGGHVGNAAKTIRVSRAQLYAVRAVDAAFLKAWDMAVLEGTGVLEDEAIRRAVHGTLKPVFQNGKRVGSVREYSDTLLQFLLRARDPHKYSDRYRHEHSGPRNGPIEVRSSRTFDVSQLTDDELKFLREISRKYPPAIDEAYKMAFKNAIARCVPGPQDDIEPDRQN